MLPLVRAAVAVVSGRAAGRGRGGGCHASLADLEPGEGDLDVAALWFGGGESGSALVRPARSSLRISRATFPSPVRRTEPAVAVSCREVVTVRATASGSGAVGSDDLGHGSPMASGADAGVDRVG